MEHVKKGLSRSIRESPARMIKIVLFWINKVTTWGMDSANVALMEVDIAIVHSLKETQSTKEWLDSMILYPFRTLCAIHCWDSVHAKIRYSMLITWHSMRHYITLRCTLRFSSMIIAFNGFITGNIGNIFFRPPIWILQLNYCVYSWFQWKFLFENINLNIRIKLMP